MIDFIVGLFYNHRYFRMAIKQIMFYISLMYLFGLLLDLYLTGKVHLNFFDWIESFYENSTAIILILTGVTFIFFAVLIYFYSQLNEKKKIKIRLEDIAHIWTNEIIDDVKEKIEKEYKHSSFLIRTVNDKAYKSKRIQRYSSEYIYNNIKFFKDEEIYIILEILSFLDDNLKVSSVPSYSKDKENLYIDKQDYFKEYNEGKSNVELLKNISLVDHTINVSEIAIEGFKNFDKKEAHTFTSISLSTVIIASIAHDIGKIKSNIILKQLGLDEIIVKEMHHADLSIEYFNAIVRKIGVYENNEVVKKSILEHHSSTVPVATLSKLIFISDKNARKKESEELIIKFKKDAEDTIKEYEKEKKERVDSEQIRILKNQLAEKDQIIDDIKKEISEEVAAKEVKQEISEEEYKRAKVISKSKIKNSKDEKKKILDDEVEKVIEEIKNSANSLTKIGKYKVLNTKEILGNTKEYLLSISDDDYIYITYYGLREIFSKVENINLGFDEMKEHRFQAALEEIKVIEKDENGQLYKKYEISLGDDDKKIKASVSLMRISISKLNLDANMLRIKKEKSDLSEINLEQIGK